MPTFRTALGGFSVKFAVTVTGDRVFCFVFSKRQPLQCSFYTDLHKVQLKIHIPEVEDTVNQSLHSKKKNLMHFLE